jgi:hypothetical protein
MWIVDNVDKSVHKSFLAEIKVFLMWKRIHIKIVDNVDKVEKCGNEHIFCATC